MILSEDIVYYSKPVNNSYVCYVSIRLQYNLYYPDFLGTTQISPDNRVHHNQYHPPIVHTIIIISRFIRTQSYVRTYHIQLFYFFIFLFFFHLNKKQSKNIFPKIHTYIHLGSAKSVRITEFALYLRYTLCSTCVLRAYYTSPC